MPTLNVTVVYRETHSFSVAVLLGALPKLCNKSQDLDIANQS